MTESTPTPIPGQTFEQWLEAAVPVIAEGQKMLEDSLSKDQSVQEAQATLTEDKYRGISDLLAEANAWLDWHEYVELMKLDRDHGTVGERDKILKFKTMGPRMLRDKIKGLSESLKARMKRAQWQA